MDVARASWTTGLVVDGTRARRRERTRARAFDVGKLAKVLRRKTANDLARVFNGAEKTRERLTDVNDILALWRASAHEETLEELEETLLGVDFGPKASARVTDGVRARVERGECETGEDVRRALKASIVDVLRSAGDSTTIGLNEREGEPSVIMVVGVNGGGKTTTLGKLSHRFAESGAKVMMVPGDTFRAAAAEQLATWAERTGAVMSDSPPNTKPGAVCFKAVDEACARGDIDIVLADTSGRLHNNTQLMDELVGVRKSISKRMEGAPHEVLLVLDGTTGLNMLNQARVFGEAVGVTGIILTKLDGTARGGAVVSVVDELGIPVKFIGVGEAMEDLQSFEAESFVDALFPEEA
ncbi:chloroplast SRP receptor cpFtsY precursor [Ostreococcus tauri]|uniref:Chloroplast SRP receptor cpFtsY n=1 Tax=Ostreococcus tauri TaxID=70448 RepID=A0A1Y5ICK6_OSTTA|nr:chloroplast SRP receptor cpFtsY precursor [Ostreococcus tauri]